MCITLGITEIWTLTINWCPKNQRTQHLESWICFCPQESGKTTALLGPLEKANLNHWTTHCSITTFTHTRAHRPMMNLWDYTRLPCEMLTALLLRGIQMGQMSKLILVNSSYFLYMLLLWVSKILASSQLTYVSLHGSVRIILIFSSNL
jgi:hypothetical protein